MGSPGFPVVTRICNAVAGCRRTVPLQRFYRWEAMGSPGFPVVTRICNAVAGCRRTVPRRSRQELMGWWPRTRGPRRLNNGALLEQPIIAYGNH